MNFKTTLAAGVVFVGLVPVCLGQALVVAQGGNLGEPALAVAADTGDFVVVWHDAADKDRGGNPIFGVFARLYDRSGLPKGPAFPVHDKGRSDQLFPRVAADPVGNFVVVWQAGSLSANRGPEGIFFQRFDSSGDRLGTLTRASSASASFSPNVAMHSDGSFEVVWQDCSQSDRCSNLRVGRFSGAGERRGSDLVIPILTFRPFPLRGPDLVPTAHLTAGPEGFVLGYTEYGDCGDWSKPERFPVVLHLADADLPFAQRYRLDDGSCVNDTGWDLAALIADSAGSSAAFFNGYEGYRNTIQRFTPHGGPAGRRAVIGKKQPCGDPCETINTAAMGSDGRSAVLWDVVESTGDPKNPIRHSLMAQLFDRKGQPAGDRFEITAGFQQPAVNLPTAAAFDAAGTLTVAWIQFREEAGGAGKARLLVRQFRWAGKPATD